MIPRNEYPDPQFERSKWENLNGEWQFEVDNGESGEERGLYKEGEGLSGKIIVPFCPESALSGVGTKDFMRSVWYKRKINIAENALIGRVFVIFGAVDNFATLFVNGIKAGTHKGGYTPFKADITKLLRSGENELALWAKDDTRSPFVPSGKQSVKFNSYGCSYTRTTGIWQTVRLEYTPSDYVESARYYADPDAGVLTVVAKLDGKEDLSISTSFDGRETGSAEIKGAQGTVTLAIRLKEKILWEIGKGNLYDVRIKFGKDEIKSYFGLRKISFDGRKFLLNGKSVFQRLVLDQGFYPDGIYTAKSDEELAADIDLSLAAGFNGARLHEKVFEPRFLYHCDKKGYIVWGEYPNWGLDHSRPEAIYSVLPEWLEEVERDFNHPAIIGWCPFNETWDVDGRKQHDELLSLVYKATKATDPTRPCIDTSGNYHTETDIFDIHDYDQNAETFGKRHREFVESGKLSNGYPFFGERQTYGGQPVFISEYGGIRWSEDEKGWGYGNAPKTEDEFLSRLRGLTRALLDNDGICGFCYTQLYDVEQEQNGIFTFHRKPKFNLEKIKEIFSSPASAAE
ncbi:MAG: beta-galactosidase [Clostridia bacterium]|nr:beta-galactosidase [Clostridia bacterium]